jgi:hypothetical protein
LALLASCGEDARTPPDRAAQGGDRPTTARALAAIAAERVGEPSSAASSRDLDELYRQDAVGAELRFGTDGEYDGDQFEVRLGTGFLLFEPDCDSPTVAENARLGGCEAVSGGLLLWEVFEPESDPGAVYVLLRKGETTVLVSQSGPTIDADPRQLDMPISVEDMFAVAQDARVDLTTSQEAIDAGAALDYWTRE